MPAGAAHLALALGPHEIGLALGRMTAGQDGLSDRLLVIDSGRDGNRLLAAIDELLASAQTPVRSIGAIAFAAGPGGFSRVRVACAVAQGLALAAKCLISPVNSLHALALAALSNRPVTEQTQIVSLVDARMQAVYCGTYTVAPYGEPTVAKAPEIIGLADLNAHLADRLQAEVPVIACGDAWQRYGLALPDQSQSAAFDPPADQIAAACLALGDLSGWLPPAQVGPIYLRDKIALNISEQAALRRSNAKSKS